MPAMVHLVFDEQALLNLLDHGTVTRFACSKGPNYKLLIRISLFYGSCEDSDVAWNEYRMAKQCSTEDMAV